MRKRYPERLRLHCSVCLRTSVFIRIGKAYQCAGDPRHINPGKRNGCGKTLKQFDFGDD